MRLGLENRKKVIFAAVSFTLALIVFTYTLHGWFASPTVPQPPATSAGTASSPMQRSRSAMGMRKYTVSANDPTLHLEWLKNSEKAEYKGSGRNIFREEDTIAHNQAPKRAPVVPPRQTSPPPPPPAPPINLKFFGFANQPGQPKKVFLSHNDDVFVGYEGQIINRRYKIVRINPNSVEVQDVLTNTTQSLPLLQG